MTLNFNHFYDRRVSDSIKWNQYDKDILPLWVADSDFPAPEKVIQELHARVDHGIFGYSRSQEDTKVSIKNWLKRRHLWDVELDDIILMPCVVQGFNFATAAYTRPGDSVLIQTPAYHPFLHVAENNHLVCTTHQLSPDKCGYYTIDLESFNNSILPNTRIFMLCNPHNPTGRVFSRDELMSMAELCLQKNIIICSDEIHSDLIYSSFQHIPIASLSPEIADQTITLISASKTFNLAGLKSSAVIITNPVLRERFRSSLQGFSSSVNLLGETAMRAAYSTGDDWLGKFIQFLEKNRSLLIKYVSEELPGINIYPPEATFLGWINCSGTGLNDPADHFLKIAKVALNPGSWFGEDYQQYARINFACHQDTLINALERIKNSLNP